MKLYALTNKECDRTIELDNIMFCFGNIVDLENNKKALQLVFAAHIKENNELIILYQNWFINNEDDLEISRILCNLSSLNANFFLENKDIYTVDFVFTKKDNKNYEFYGISKDNVKFIINKCLVVGVGIMQQVLLSGRIEDRETLFEINNWLCNRNNKRTNAEFSKLTKYEILDMSRTVKFSKNYYKRIVIIKFTVTTAILDIEKEYIVVMVYNSSKSKRNKKNTKDIELLSQIYHDAYAMYNIKGIITTDKSEKNIIQIIGYDINGNYIVLNSDAKIIQQLYLDIEDM